jgi:hypothetical protein
VTLNLLPARLKSKIIVNDQDCWEWQGCKIKGGYGRASLKGKLILTHRLTYQILVKDIPKGLTLDHLCKNTSCCNPKHLEPVTLKENLLRGRTGLNLLKTHCPQGHPYDEINTYMLRGKWRRCRICVRKATLNWYHKKRR